MFFKQAQAVADDFAGAGITSAFELVLNEMLEMFADNVARWHGEPKVKAGFVKLSIIDS